MSEPSFCYGEKDVVRFMTFVEKLPSGCWYWTGARSRGKGNRKWYSSFRVKDKMVRGHRFSCEAIDKRPPLPAGWHRDHTCQFSMCVNPGHIEYTTHEENQDRKVQRRRTA